MLPVLATIGCATPVVLDRWKAHDAVEQVRFQLIDTRRDQPELAWRVESRGLPGRPGKIVLPGVGKGCDRLTLASRDGLRVAGRASRKLVIPLERSAGLRESPDPSSPAAECAVVIDLVSGTGSANPRFDLRRNGTSIVEIETPPPRRGGWLAVVPLAAIADAPLAAAGLVVLPIALIPYWLGALDDFTWVPGHDIDWHRRASDEKRENGER